MYNRQFIHTFREAVRDTDIPAAYKLLLFTMSTYADSEGGDVRPSQATLAREVCSSRFTVIRHLKHLQEAGWVELVKRGYGGADGRSTRSANVYQLRVGREFVIKKGDVLRHAPDMDTVSAPEAPPKAPVSAPVESLKAPELPPAVEATEEMDDADGWEAAYA